MRIKINEAIKQAGVKKGYIANQIGISKTYFNQYISKPSSISIENAITLCQLTNRRLDELDFGDKASLYFDSQLHKN